MASRMLRQSQHGEIVPRETDDGGCHVNAATLRFARSDEYDAAIADVEAWGYRALRPGEANGSTWVAVERGEERIGWWWLQWMAPGCAVLHLCAKPGERILTRHTMRGFAWVAELFGAKRLYTSPPAGSAAVGYLRRMAWAGWREEREGVFCLGGCRA